MQLPIEPPRCWCIFAVKIFAEEPISLSSKHNYQHYDCGMSGTCMNGREKLLNRIKWTVSQRINIASDRLNEISLEDVEIDQVSQDRIYQALHDMTMGSDLSPDRMDRQETSSGIPCTGFWVEDTQELILFAWCEHNTKTFIIPSDEWFLREDITIH